MMKIASLLFAGAAMPICCFPTGWIILSIRPHPTILWVSAAVISSKNWPLLFTTEIWRRFCETSYNGPYQWFGHRKASDICIPIADRQSAAASVSFVRGSACRHILLNHAGKASKIKPYHNGVIASIPNLLIQIKRGACFRLPRTGWMRYNASVRVLSARMKQM